MSVVLASTQAQAQSIHQRENDAAAPRTQCRNPSLLQPIPSHAGIDALLSASAATAHLGEQDLDLLNQLIELDNLRRRGGPPI